MLADINLLPQKPPKNVANHVTILVTLLGITIGLVHAYQTSTAIQTETEYLIFQKSVVETQARRIEQELDLLEATHSDIVTQENIIDALNETIYTRQVIDEARNHLPTNAVVVSYSYSGGETLTFRIWVDESKEVGNFAESLSTVPWVQQARVESVTLDHATDGKFLGSVIVTLSREDLTRWEWEGTE